MWWSCSDASCSELFPESTLNLDEDARELIPFTDELRIRKLKLKRGENPIDIWMDLMSSYGRTSVTFGDDRIVAIAGIARRFSSWFPDLLGSADLFGHFHSGIWSKRVIHQLLWKCDPTQQARHSQGYQSYIPSWSPLSSLRCDPMYTYKHTNITLAEYVEIGFSGTTGVFGTDGFGRVQNESEAVLHLRGILAPIIVRDERTGLPFQVGEQGEEGVVGETTWRATKVRLKDYSEEEGLTMVFDTVEEAARALSPSEVNGVDLRALPCEGHHWCNSREEVQIDGIVLRPDYEASQRTIKNEEIQRNLWVRCGSFECRIQPQSANGFLRAFALERYGWTFKTGVLYGEDSARFASTGAAPDLDDVFII